MKDNFYIPEYRAIYITINSHTIKLSQNTGMNTSAQLNILNAKSGNDETKILAKKLNRNVVNENQRDYILITPTDLLDILSWCRNTG